ncbi:MAG: DUF58 domain-containing protein [Bacillus sp. (in: Bacteria)]|nr:DUF58 domain-containing protein [Bacillus sp. (in: firmicutes)]MCM1427534.1 DUF58 domain-containing protein [Eubacterium sp.]
MMRIIGLGICAYLLILLQRVIYGRLWAKHLKIRLEFTQTSLFEGEKGELSEIIENGKRLPLPMLKVKFQTDRNLRFTDTLSSKVTDLYYRNDIFQVRGRERITRKLEFIAAKRGYYRIHNIDLVAADLFLSTEMVKSQHTDQYFYVYPAPYVSDEFRQSLQQLNGELLTKRHFLEDPFEYRGIREYQPYDDMRSVNWKASAKTGELKVNQKNYTALQTIRIFFNIEDNGVLKKEDALDASFRIVAGLSAFFIKQGVRVACYGNGRDIMHGELLQIEAGAGAGQLQQIYRALARTDTSQKPAGFVQTFEQKLLEEDGESITVFVSPNAYPDFVELISRYQKQDGEYIWFYPTIETAQRGIPELSELPGEIKSHIQILHIENDDTIIKI